ncbi:MAG: hypothetical protein KME17_21835 [Cyanosarcina radialis HA8281-LM2]|nr:hypothetical protein [Cyanosarcina radialis HA8281-LM2]
MRRTSNNLGVKIATWLVAELILNLSGLDNLADCGEFVFGQEISIASNQPAIVVLHRPPDAALQPM